MNLQSVDSVNVSNLEKKLSHRPEAEELVQRNVLKGLSSSSPPPTVFTSLDSSVAPGLQAQLQNLQKAKVEDFLEKKLDGRPTADALVTQHILKGF